jgi:hypothetical protein
MPPASAQVGPRRRQAGEGLREPAVVEAQMALKVGRERGAITADKVPDALLT